LALPALPLFEVRVLRGVVFTGVWFGFLDPVRAVRKPEVSLLTPQVPGIVEFVRSRLGFEPDAAQIAVLESTAKQGILNCSRQWGKSTVSAAKALHRAYTVPKSLVLVASPTERQSAEWMRKARDMASRLGFPLRGDGDNKISLLLPNGSRIVGLPGTEATIRGFSAVSLMLVDAASRVSDELYLAIRPMLAVSDGTLWLMSTPFGKRGFFYDVWSKGSADWMRVRVPATECPRISKDFLEEEREAMGERWYRQEYLCEFVDSTSGVFGRDLVEKAITKDVEPLEF